MAAFGPPFSSLALARWHPERFCAMILR